MKASEILTEKQLDELFETASSGGTSAGSVATSVGGLGAGFDPNGDHGIYEKPKKQNRSKSKTIVARR